MQLLSDTNPLLLPIVWVRGKRLRIKGWRKYVRVCNIPEGTAPGNQSL